MAKHISEVFISLVRQMYAEHKARHVEVLNAANMGDPVQHIVDYRDAQDARFLEINPQLTLFAHRAQQSPHVTTWRHPLNTVTRKD